ncbi:hypothetical protein K435DRAFT_805604 [Dendrothele bispora CBS 962.96]|uniref:Glucose-methanol-choline oxidoreductase C-terminal domain-containing protein n=1 Tax=Dendrothele bispora (strain CBS 962.96) TaxID=1314807 RepID=A0A4S8LBW0_DENBC|nr:hypothetical protein K435DRAFT_805604 [Dendrothele bispora CBS 962.96]
MSACSLRRVSLITLSNGRSLKISSGQVTEARNLQLNHFNHKPVVIRRSLGRLRRQVQVNFASFTTYIDSRAINSWKELEASGAGGESFKFTDDMNAGDSIGFAVLVAQSADGLFGIRRILLLYAIGPKDELASAHIELLFTNGFAALGDTKQPDEGHFLTKIAVVSHKSEGSLTLTSAEGGAFTHPNIDYGLLTNEFDLVAIQQALRDADTFLNATSWTSPSPSIIAPFGDWATARDGTDADRDAYIRMNRITLVKGIKGVRVVDASIFPSIPECHPQGPVYTVGEKGAQLIKEDHGLA